MTQARWSGDDALLADLKEALTYGAPSGDADLELGRAAFAWRTVDEELARLSYDSLLDDHATTRSGAVATRSLLFAADDVSVEIDVLPRRVVGQLVPPVPGDIIVQSPAGELTRVRADDAGCFSATVDVPSDVLVRLRCITDSATVVTEWVAIHQGAI